jgi:Co/Zn/Cd efflux system component
VVGTLYQDSPARLCNAYRLDDQQMLGTSLVAVSVAILAAWLLHLGLRQSLKAAARTESAAHDRPGSASRRRRATSGDAG